MFNRKLFASLLSLLIYPPAGLSKFSVNPDQVWIKQISEVDFLTGIYAIAGVAGVAYFSAKMFPSFFPSKMGMVINILLTFMCAWLLSAVGAAVPVKSIIIIFIMLTVLQKIIFRKS